MVKKKRVVQPQKPNVVPIHMDATFFFERAVQSLDRYHYEKALKYFRRAVEYEPDNPVNHCNMAGILSEMGNYEESNSMLNDIVERIDPKMTECYFYMANNYANMDDFESAETALVAYLERDPNGQFLEECEDMLELFSYELNRPVKLKNIKSREGLFEHDKARELLEDGQFSKAVRILEKLVKRHPDFLAARNNLALAYYYIGDFEKSFRSIEEVLEIDNGNLHALCNLAIFYQHAGEDEELEPLLDLLAKTYPFHQEQVFKLATTMGILGQHAAAYRHFKRLIKGEEAVYDPCIYHYTAVAACNMGRYREAAQLWKQAEKLDPDSDIPRFYLSELEKWQADPEKSALSYHYHLPFEEQFRDMDQDAVASKGFANDPLVRSSFLWALRHGDHDTKLQVIEAFGKVRDSEVEQTLRKFLMNPEEDDYLKKVAIFVLRSIGASDPLHVVIGGKKTVIDAMKPAPHLPVWEKKWQDVIEKALSVMNKRYDMIQQHDLQTLWIEFLTRVYPAVPKFQKVSGWAAALEYLTAKMHHREVSYHEVASRYGVSVGTVSKNVRLIDQTCELRQKMKAIFPQFGGSF